MSRQLPVNNGLLAAIIADPDEDIRRLAYADWLDEISMWDDNPAIPQFAAFIRLHIEWVRHRDSAACSCHSGENGGNTRVQCDRCRQMSRAAGEAAFLLVNLVWPLTEGTPWAAETVLDLPSNSDFWFGRGWIEHGRCSAADWIRLGDATQSRHPVRKVTLEVPTRTPSNAPDRRLCVGDEWNGYCVVGDPKKKVFTPHELKDATEKRGGTWNIAILSLRWPGVEFVIQEPRRR